jgi:uncharacterized protein (UPF0332 family)
LLDVLHYSDEAPRAAYLAGFHAAQSLIFERTARVAKSHSGLRTTFARLAKDDPRIDRTFTRFLARAYKSKEIANYGIGPQAVVTAAEAREMIDLATRCLRVAIHNGEYERAGASGVVFGISRLALSAFRGKTVSSAATWLIGFCLRGTIFESICRTQIGGSKWRRYQ